MQNYIPFWQNSNFENTNIVYSNIEYRYVQDMLKGTKRVVRKKSNIFQNLCYDPTSYYRYHSRILSTVVSGLIGLYSNIIFWVAILIPITENLVSYLENNWFIIFSLNAAFDPDGYMETEKVIKFVGFCLTYIR